MIYKALYFSHSLGIAYYSSPPRTLANIVHIFLGGLLEMEFGNPSCFWQGMCRDVGKCID